MKIKTLLVPALALALIAGCGQGAQEEAEQDQVQGGQGQEEAAQEREHDAPEMPTPEEITYERASLGDVTSYARNTIYDITYLPGVHQIVDEEEGRVFLFVTLPHIPFGTSLEVSAVEQAEEGFTVQLNFTEVEATDRGSVFNAIYELNGKMTAFTAIDQNGTSWGTASFEKGERATIAQAYRSSGDFNNLLRISQPEFDAGLPNGELTVTGYLLTTQQVNVSLVQGETVIGSVEVAGASNEQWTPFTATINAEGVEAGGEPVTLQFEGEGITEEWLVESF